MKDKPGAYLESSVWNRLVDRKDPDRRRITRRFLATGPRKLRWFVSIAVTDELDETPDHDLRNQLQRQVYNHGPRVIPTTRKAERVLEDLLGRGVGTPAKLADTLHLAMAIAGGMDYLVTWDERDLATERINRLVRAYCRERGYNEVRIGTPIEVLEWVSRESI